MTLRKGWNKKIVVVKHENARTDEDQARPQKKWIKNRF